MAIDGGEVKIRFEGDIDPLRRSVEEAIDNIEGLKDASNDLDKNISGFGDKAKQEFDKFANSATESFVKAIDSSDILIGNIKNIGSALKSIGFGALTAGATAATKTLINMAKAGIQDTSALEDIQIQMIGLTHSVEAGNAAMSMAVKYYKNNPFNRFEVTNATKSLIQFGAELKQVPELLDQMGKVSLSTGAKIDTVAYYYQKLISDGRINTLDLIQMGNQNIPIIGALADRLQTTAGGIRELAAQGKISIEDFKEAFKTLADDDARERFDKTFSRQVDRFKGRISDMKGALAGYYTTEQEGLVILENGLYSSARNLLKRFADVMTSTGDSANPVGVSVVEGFQKVGTAIGKVIDQITKLVEPALNILGKLLNFIGDNSELLVPILGTLAVALGKLGSGLPVIGDLIKGVTGNFVKLKSGIMGVVSAHPLLSAFIGLLAVGFADAMKNDEEFRDTITELSKSLSDLVSNLMSAVRGVLPVFVDLIKQIASSDAIKGILKVVAEALKNVAQALASIPPEVLSTLISFFVGLKLLNANPIIFAVTAIGLLIQYIKELGGVSEFFEKLPETLNTIGHNMMTGLFNGVKEGATKVINFVKQVARSIVDGFKNILGIHSPSTVMYEVGQNIVLGLANGVEDTSNVMQVAMNKLASDILKLGEKVISNKVSFGIIDVQGEYKAWKQFSQLFTEGSEQYAYAIEKMEEARKRANLEILNLQKTYNDALDASISKISSMYGLFDEVSSKSTSNSSKVLKNLDQQVSKMQEWSSAQEKISQLDLAPEFIKELQAMGVSSTSELSSIANMTADELSTLNNLWLQKQAIANDAGVEQMKGLKEDTLKQINALKSGIDDATIDVSDVGGKLVENISEGIYGAMPTLENAFSKLGDYIAQAQKELGGTNTGTGNGNDKDNNYDDLTKGVKEEIEANLEKLKSQLPNILLGIIGAWGAFKFGPKILGAIANKLFSKGTNVADTIGGTLARMAEGGKLGKVDLTSLVDELFANASEGSSSQKILSKLQDKLKGLGDDGTLQEATKKISKTTGSTRTIAKSTSEVSQNLTSTGQSISKASGILNTVKEGAQTIIWIAGAIAAMAGALWLTSKAFQDIDYKALNSGLVEMGVAIAEFGVLAVAGERLGVSVKGILTIVGVAADIALVALACRAAYELMGNIDFGKFQLVLIEMAEAVVAMGALATAAGVLMELTAGAMALGMLAIVGIAADIVAISLSIRLAWDSMKDIDFVRYQAVLGMMIETLAVFGGFSTIIGIFSGLVALGWVAVVAVCDELVKTSDALLHVYNTVPDDIVKVKTKVTLIKETLQYVSQTDIGQFISALATGITVGPLTATMEMYEKIAGMLARMSELTIDDTKVTRNIESVKTALQKVKSKTNIIGGILQGWAQEKEVKSIEASGRILVIYSELVDAINKLGNLKVDNSIYSSISSIASIIKNVKDTSSNMFQWFENPSKFVKDVEHIQRIVRTFIGLIPDIKKISSEEGAIASNATENVKNIRDLIWEISQINTEGVRNAGIKEKVVDSAVRIASKFKEIHASLKELDTTDYSSLVTNMVTAINNLLSGISEKISTQYESFKDLGTKLSENLRDGMVSVSFEKAGGQVQSQFWSAIQNRMNDEYNQGRSMGETFRQGLYDIDYANAGWWAVQGFVNGANNRGHYAGGDSVYWVGYRIANEFLKGLKDRGEQGSPWKTTMQSGQWAVEGLIEGLESQESALVGEAYSLADQVVDALSLNGVSMTPELDASVSGRLTPSMFGDDYGITENGRGVVINQEIQAYTPIDMDAISRNLAWDLSNI